MPFTDLWLEFFLLNDQTKYLHRENRCAIFGRIKVFIVSIYKKDHLRIEKNIFNCIQRCTGFFDTFGKYSFFRPFYSSFRMRA